MQESRRLIRGWSRTVFLGLLVFLCSEITMFYVYRGAEVFFTGRDLQSYVSQGLQILDGRMPHSMFKPMGTGLWFASYIAITHDNGGMYPLVSCFALGLLPLLWFGVGALLQGSRLGLCLAGAMLASPVCVIPSCLWEPPAMLAIGAAFVLASAAVRTGRLAFLMPATVCMGLASIVRTECALYLAGVVGVLLTLRDPRVRICAVTGMVCGFIVLMGLNVALTSREYGAFRPVQYDATARYYRTFQCGGNERVSRVDVHGEATARMMQALREARYIPSDAQASAAILGGSRAYLASRLAARKMLGSWYEADNLLKQACVESWRYSPADYLLDAGSTFLGFALFSRQHWAESPDSIFYRWRLPLELKTPESRMQAKPPYEFLYSEPAFLESLDLDQSPRINTAAQQFHTEVKRVRAAGGKRGDAPFAILYRRLLPWMPLVLYPGVLLLLLKNSQVRSIGLGVLGGTFVIWTAYSLTAWYEDRYMYAATWPVWLLSAWGYAGIIGRIRHKLLSGFDHEQVVAGGKSNG